MFNKDIELRIVKIENEVYSKTIKDEDYKDRLDDEYMFIKENKLEKGARLVVRNYCDVDENSQVVIAESRLVGVGREE